MISLLGIVVITLVCDVILPQGQTTKYVKTVISVIVVCAIVFPLVDLVSDIDIELLQSTNTAVEFQQGYLDYVKVEKEKGLIQLCNDKFAEKGIDGCELQVKLDDELMPIEVCVYIKKQSYTDKMTEKVLEVVLSVVNVDKSEVTCVVKN